MSFLAIDTATQVSSVAVASVDKLAAELTMQAKLTHSETLMPHIKEVLRMANVRKEQLEGIAVSIGPGSFTGLRIGLAAAKAMAYALNLPIVGVSTLKALAYHYPVPGIRIVSLLDAQKGNAYRESCDIAARRIRGKVDLPSNVSVAPAHLVMPRAACVAMLGLQEFTAGHADNVMNMEPVYIRRSEAEVLWEKRHPEGAK